MEYKLLLPPGVISGLIVGVFAILGVFLTHTVQNRRDKKRQREIIQGVLQAVYDELSILYMHFNSPIVESSWKRFKYEEEERKFFDSVLPVSQDHLITYRSNANLIGQIKDPDLRRKIVQTYMILQVLLESYIINNKLLNQYAEAESKKEVELVAGLDRHLQAIAPMLEKWHNLFKELTEKLLEMLKKELS